MALSIDTAIIGSSLYDYMGSEIGSVYVFDRQDGGTWEEVHKINPAGGEAGDQFGFRLAISSNTAVIAVRGDDMDRGYDSGYGYVYTIIGRKWNKSGKIVPEDGAAYDEFGYNFPL